MTFGDRLKTLIQLKYTTRATQSGFANMARINKSQLNKLINNKRKPNAKEIEALTNALDVSYDTLLGKDYLREATLKDLEEYKEKVEKLKC